jgi:hypothetical protein
LLKNGIRPVNVNIEIGVGHPLPIGIGRAHVARMQHRRMAFFNVLPCFLWGEFGAFGLNLAE